ncbi:aminoglycoside phosphotransferase family protein [Isoptericola sp. 4D.3]|uniref:Aminoglycoside phosphotransferase family protein n=1 Tax=Isoptericola peretonis TaxID=2918523 RepID=A0ABT0IZG0_9MICO|nr:aminoglycoside phosphotransferase family protein [Isoptericola sp. 4D.3]
MPTTAPTAPADHPAWLDLLTGDAAGDVLAAALAADGAGVESWSVRQVHARPGAEVTVAYEVVARRGTGDGAVRVTEHLFATSAPDTSFRRARGAGDRGDGPGPGVVRLDDGARALHVWRHPHDPALPGLEAGSTPSRVEGRLRDAGLDVAVRSLETVTYRPLRRAVLRARTGDAGAAGGSAAERVGTAYVKVVRPSKVGDLVRRHALFAGHPRAAAVVAPRVLTWSADGVVLLEEVPGVSVAERIAGTPAAAQAACLDPAEVLRVATRLPGAGRALPRRPAWADRLGRYAHAVVSVQGVPAERMEGLAARIRAAAAAGDPGPLGVTHGDLHAANLLLEPAPVAAASPSGRAVAPRVGAVLDVDTLGPGHLVDDLACAVAHLAVLPVLDPAAYAGVGGLVRRWLAAFDAEVDPALLRARAAAVVVSLAAGTQDAATAEAFLAVAERLVGAAAEV